MLKNKRDVVRAIAIVLGICFLGFAIFNLIMKVEHSSADNPVHTYSIKPKDYDLVNNKYVSGLQGGIAYQSSNRNPVTLIPFGKSYSLISYKIDLIKGTSWSNVLDVTLKSVERTNMEVYTVISENIFYRFEYHDAPTKSVSKVYLTLSGDSLRTVVTNDSIVSYHLLCNNFSIKYSENEAVDIFVVGNEKAFGATTVIPMDLLFLKRDNAVYLMIMTPNDPKSVISPELLYNLVTGKG